MKKHFLLNIRIYRLQFQIEPGWHIKFIFFGFQIIGVRFFWAKQKKLGKLMWLFNFGNKYWEMRDYHGTGKLNKWRFKNHVKI